MVRAEVADHLPLGQRSVNRGKLGHVHRDGAATPRGVARTSHLQSRVVGELDQPLGLAKRVLPDPLDTDLLDQVVAGRSA